MVWRSLRWAAHPVAHALAVEIDLTGSGSGLVLGEGPRKHARLPVPAEALLMVRSLKATPGGNTRSTRMKRWTQQRWTCVPERASGGRQIERTTQQLNPIVRWAVMPSCATWGTLVLS